MGYLMMNNKVKKVTGFVKVITKDEVQKMRLKGKPLCPNCSIPLTFVYEGSIGFSGEKCQRCKQTFLVNTETLQVMTIKAS